MGPSTLELCAGAGGQALGLEMAGFEHAGLIENDSAACKTLRLNRPEWNVIEHDLFEPLDLSSFRGVDLLSGGLPCPPFSVAGKQLGEGDERNWHDTINNEQETVLRPPLSVLLNVVARVVVGFDRTQMDQPRPGATAIPRIRCGAQPLGYVWLHDLIDAIRTRLLF